MENTAELKVHQISQIRPCWRGTRCWRLLRRALTVNHQSRSGGMQSVGWEKQENVPRSDSAQETETESVQEPLMRENRRQNHRQGASGENPRRKHSQRASVYEEESNTGTWCLLIVASLLLRARNFFWSLHASQGPHVYNVGSSLDEVLRCGL